MKLRAGCQVFILKAKWWSLRMKSYNITKSCNRNCDYKIWVVRTKQMTITQKDDLVSKTIQKKSLVLDCSMHSAKSVKQCGKPRLDSNLFLAWAIFRLGSGGFNVCLLDYVFPWLPSPIGFKYEHKVEHCLAFGHHQSFREFQLFWSLEKLGWKQKTQNFNVTEKWSGMYSKLTKLGENIYR